MEIMAMPREETLIYLRQIDDWVATEKFTKDGVILTFQKNTPAKIILLFEKIKDNLDFKVKKYTIVRT